MLANLPDRLAHQHPDPHYSYNQSVRPYVIQIPYMSAHPFFHFLSRKMRHGAEGIKTNHWRISFCVLISYISALSWEQDNQPAQPDVTCKYKNINPPLNGLSCGQQGREVDTLEVVWEVLRLRSLFSLTSSPRTTILFQE